MEKPVLIIDAGDGKRIVFKKNTPEEKEFLSFLRSQEINFFRNHIKYCLLDESLKVPEHKNLTNGTVTLERNYYLHKFLTLSLKNCKSGNILCAGVSYGTSALILSSLTNIASIGGKWILVDPMEGVGRPEGFYNTNKDLIVQRWDDVSSLQFVQKYLNPELCKELPPLLFAHLNTGSADAESSTLPYIIEKLLPSGSIIIDQYGRVNDDFRQAVDKIVLSYNCTTIYIKQTRQLVIIKI